MNEVKIKEHEPKITLAAGIDDNSPSVKERTKKTNTGNKEKGFIFKREDAGKWLPFTLFVFIMVVFYISVQQYAEKVIRNTEKLNKEIKELRSEYLSTKAELMKESMQTDIARKLEGAGLKELREPAIKLKLEKSQ